MIAKISKGSQMDQIYLPKQRQPGLMPGTFVRITVLSAAERTRPYFRNCDRLEPWKIAIIDQVFRVVMAENVLITGSFIESGKDFEDIDMIVIGPENKKLAQKLENEIGLPFHIVALSYRSLQEGIRTDPLFQAMLSKFVAKQPLPPSVFAQARTYRYRQLDLHLLESKALLESFEYLNGREKFKLLRNAITIVMFLERKTITAETIRKEIEHRFGAGTVKRLKENMLSKQPFLKTFKGLYDGLFTKIMKGVRNESE